MTAPRMAMFQRKGAPPPMVDSSEAGAAALDGSPQDNADAPPVGTEPVVCPNCQCTFDPSSGEIMDMGNSDEGEGGMPMAEAHPMPEGMMPMGGGMPQ